MHIINIQTHTNTHIHLHTHTHMNTHTHNTHTHLCIHPHKFIHEHTQTPTRSSFLFPPFMINFSLSLSRIVMATCLFGLTMKGASLETLRKKTKRKTKRRRDPQWCHCCCCFLLFLAAAHHAICFPSTSCVSRVCSYLLFMWWSLSFFFRQSIRNKGSSSSNCPSVV